MKKLLTFFISLISFAVSQETEVYFNQAAEDFFLLGMRQYSQKEFKPALLSFQRSLASYPSNHRTTASLMMAAKSHFALKNYTDAIITCDTLLAQYPSSLYKEDVYFTRGMCYYSIGDYSRTFSEMVGTYAIAEQRLNQEHSLKVIEHLAMEFFSDSAIASLITDSLQRDIVNVMKVVLAEKYFQNGRIDDAKSVVESIEQSLVEETLQFRINRLLSRIGRGNLVRIGVLVPLHRSTTVETREKKIAAEVLEGIQLAVSDYEEQKYTAQVSLELDIQDSEKDSSKILSLMSQWGVDSTVTVIIGPVFSAETMVAARIAQEQSIPIVTPTATDEGISSVGRYVFQANSTNGAKGKAMAQYAVNVLGAKKIAVLGSLVQSSAIQADSFIVEAQRLGASVIIDRRFRRGETDLRSHARAIRLGAANLRPDYIVEMVGKINYGEIIRKLSSIGIKMSYIDSIIAAKGAFNFTLFFGDSAKAVADSLRMPVKKTLIYGDSLNYPVSTLDAVYCPISNSHEIGVITSQLAFFNIKAQLLGTGDWNDANELDLNKRYTDGLIFGLDRWIDKNMSTSRTFTKYAQRYGKPISDNVLFGYDAMSMLIAQFQQGLLTREQLTEKLAVVVEFPGIRNSITLQPDRVNGALHILEYKNGAVSKLQTFSYH